MKPVAWIKIRELSYMKAVAEHGKHDWQTNLGLKPEPDHGHKFVIHKILSDDKVRDELVGVYKKTFGAEA